jgi:hypothetical protein
VVELFKKSKRSLIGDKSYVGFVNAVLDQVPNTSLIEEGTSSFGYLIYVHTLQPAVGRQMISCQDKLDCSIMFMKGCLWGNVNR